MDQELREIHERPSRGTSGDSRNLETVITIGQSGDVPDSDAKSSGSVMNTAAVEDGAAKVEGEDKCLSIPINLKSSDFVGENLRVCRICHLSAKESGKSFTKLMEIGCECKGELGVAHSDCAEAWFRIRGNRSCEICGTTAKNVTGVSDNGFMEEWNERRSADSNASTSDGGWRCLHGQPLCNFLMACLVIAFVLPWVFRVNMFY